MIALPPVVAWLAFVLTFAVHAAPDEPLLVNTQPYPAAGPAALAPHLVANEEPEHLLKSFTGALQERFDHRIVRKGPRAMPLARAPGATTFSYEHEGHRLNVDDYLRRQRVTSLLVIKDSTVVLERYQYGRGPATRFLSASMVKSIVGLLVGIALEERRIRSLDDLAKVYVPALAGNPYGETSVRDLLQMSSGVRFSELYDGSGDLSSLIDDTVGGRSPGGEAALLRYSQRRVAPGRMFYYSSADTQALSLVLRGATGVPVADYLSERIWQPLGARDDASFLVDAAGHEAAFAFMHATLDDFGRLGMLLANDGKVGDRQVVPAAWVRQSTTITQAHAQPFVASSYFGYGNHIWIFPGERRRFALIGVRGQVIFVDPELRLVLVQTAVWKSAGDRVARAELLALWRGVVERYGAW